RPVVAGRPHRVGLVLALLGLPARPRRRRQQRLRRPRPRARVPRRPRPDGVKLLSPPPAIARSRSWSAIVAGPRAGAGAAHDPPATPAAALGGGVRPDA